MAGLFLVPEGGTAAASLSAARRAFASHGFSEPREVNLPGWRLLHAGYIHGGPETLLVAGDDVVAVAGTMTVEGLMGRAALERLLRTAEPPALDRSRIGGQFICLLRKRGRTFLFGDGLGAFQLFHDADGHLFSTSLLAALEVLPRVRFDAQGVYEFAFNVVPIGDVTVIEELKTLGPGRMVELGTDGTTTLHPLARPRAAVARDEPPAERVTRHRDALMRVIDTHVAAFGDHVHCPLSGGMDSRLLLAAFRAAGSRPMVYVYGPDGSEDVRIAQAIGAAEGFAVEWINKAARDISPDAFAEQVANNFRRFDGLPNFGNIFDNGGHLAAMDARHADGALLASGGAGEIYRDFFYLPDRPMRAEAVARTFFARFTPSDATGVFEPRRFVTEIARKIGDAIDQPADAGPIPRLTIEQIYPRVRCRALFGREISIEARHGAYLMPFLDSGVVAEAMTLPMRLKQAGRFEAMLIDAIDPALARHPSAYGHHFAEPPSRRHRFGEWQSRIRPPWLRARSYGIQRRLRPIGDEHGGLLTPEYMERVIDTDFPIMRRYFHPERITDSGLWRRIACLEYLGERLGSRLAT